MKSTCTWVKNMQSVVDNGRKHSIVIDLPEAKDGDDQGATALELAVMGLSGCVATIFRLFCKKMHLDIEKIEVILEADKGPDDPTITSVQAEVRVKSPEKEDKLQKALDRTMQQCPVGVLYSKAEIPMNIKLNKI